MFYVISMRPCGNGLDSVLLALDSKHPEAPGRVLGNCSNLPVSSSSKVRAAFAADGTVTLFVSANTLHVRYTSRMANGRIIRTRHVDADSSADIYMLAPNSKAPPIRVFSVDLSPGRSGSASQHIEDFRYAPKTKHFYVHIGVRNPRGSQYSRMVEAECKVMSDRRARSVVRDIGLLEPLPPQIGGMALSMDGRFLWYFACRDGRIYGGKKNAEVVQFDMTSRVEVKAMPLPALGATEAWYVDHLDVDPYSGDIFFCCVGGHNVIPQLWWMRSPNLMPRSSITMALLARQDTGSGLTISQMRDDNPTRVFVSADDGIFSFGTNAHWKINNSVNLRIQLEDRDPHMVQYGSAVVSLPHEEQ